MSENHSTGGNGRADVIIVGGGSVGSVLAARGADADRPVGEVTRELLAAVRSLGGPLEVDPTPQEVWWSVPLAQDDEHTTYDPEAVAWYFTAATRAALVLAAFRAPHRGRSTQVNAWWGSFDLAVNLFSGSPADPPSADFTMRNAMDAQESSRARPFATPAPFANGTRAFSPAPKGHLLPSGDLQRSSLPAAYARSMTASSLSATSAELIGREREIERVEAVLGRLPDGGGALVIPGEAGIGKSALLEVARRRAAELGTRELVTAGVESGAELAFAGLHQLLHPIAQHMDLLPDPQRRALESAFGISGEVEPDPFLVALAAFELVCAAADSRPLLLAVDDVHWLDRSSLAVLTFIARRLVGEPVVLVAAVREGYDTALEEAGLEIMPLERLSASAAAELLDRSAPDLHPVVRARLLAEAAGNPLALVELARVPGPVAIRGRLSPSPISLTLRLERAFAARLDGLPEATGLLLLAAALDTRVSLEELGKAASRVHGRHVEISALDPAVEAGLVDVVDTGLVFRHPLIRSAVQDAALPARVLAMYGALADVVADPERRLWHRAMAAVGHDEEIAAALVERARLARRRGAVSVAAAALERAALLSATCSRCAIRASSAAAHRARDRSWGRSLAHPPRRRRGEAAGSARSAPHAPAYSPPPGSHRLRRDPRVAPTLLLGHLADHQRPALNLLELLSPLLLGPLTRAVHAASSPSGTPDSSPSVALRRAGPLIAVRELRSP